MQIKKRSEKGFIILSLIGDMETYGAEELENTALEVIKKGEKNIILDFDKLEYISSIGLRAVLTIRTQIQKTAGRLVLVSLRDKVIEVFRTSKLLDIFQVHKDVEDAIK